MEEIWIIGLGQFGFNAFQKLSQSSAIRRFVLVDPVERNLLKCKSSTTSLKVYDGVEFLEKYLSKRRKPDWIVPALPIHLAAEWILKHTGQIGLRRISLPFEIEKLVPNCIRGSEGNIYMSHATFRCPVNCDEPQNTCVVTQKNRNQNMFELLGNLDIDGYKSLNIRSRQLGPGIGGYRPEKLFELMEDVKDARGPVLVSTACRCHGVMTGIERL